MSISSISGFTAQSYEPEQTEFLKPIELVNLYQIFPLEFTPQTFMDYAASQGITQSMVFTASSTLSSAPAQITELKTKSVAESMLYDSSTSSSFSAAQSPASTGKPPRARKSIKSNLPSTLKKNSRERERRTMMNNHFSELSQLTKSKTTDKSEILSHSVQIIKNLERDVKRLKQFNASLPPIPSNI